LVFLILPFSQNSGNKYPIAIHINVTETIMFWGNIRARK
jgi:hypothetical protein